MTNLGGGVVKMQHKLDDFWKTVPPVGNRLPHISGLPHVVFLQTVST